MHTLPQFSRKVSKRTIAISQAITRRNEKINRLAAIYRKAKKLPKSIGVSAALPASGRSNPVAAKTGTR